MPPSSVEPAGSTGPTVSLSKRSGSSFRTFQRLPSVRTKASTLLDHGPGLPCCRNTGPLGHAGGQPLHLISKAHAMNRGKGHGDLRQAPRAATRSDSVHAAINDDWSVILATLLSFVNPAPPGTTAAGTGHLAICLSVDRLSKQVSLV